MTRDDEKIRVKCKACGEEFEVYADEIDKEVKGYGAIYDTDYEYTREEYAECPHCGEWMEVSYEYLDWDELTHDEQDELIFWGTVSDADYQRVCDECLGLF